jgi:maltose-binding protein MalE
MVHTLADQFSQQYGIALTVMPKDPDSLRVDMITADLRDSPTPHIIWGTHDDLANLLQDEAIQPITRITHTLSTDILTATRQSATYADQIWGYPLSAQDFLLLHYNKKLLDTPPQTTNQLIEQVRSIATTEPTPTTTDSANPLPRFGMVAAWGEPYWLLAWLNGMGGSITNTDGTLPTLNTEQMTNTLYLLRELYATAPPKQWGYEAMVNTYRAGEAVIAIDGVWSMATYREYTTTLALGMATMPIVPSTGRIAASPLGTSYLMIHRDTLGEMLTASHMFATFLMTPTVQLSLALQLQRLPVSLALLDSPEIGGDPVLALAAAQAPYAPSIPPTSTSRCALLAIRHYLPLVLAGDIAQPDGLERMQQAAETCMRGDRW